MGLPTFTATFALPKRTPGNQLGPGRSGGAFAGRLPSGLRQDRPSPVSPRGAFTAAAGISNATWPQTIGPIVHPWPVPWPHPAPVFLACTNACLDEVQQQYDACLQTCLLGDRVCDNSCKLAAQYAREACTQMGCLPGYSCCFGTCCGE
jgi:hypothetical protein